MLGVLNFEEKKLIGFLKLKQSFYDNIFSQYSDYSKKHKKYKTNSNWIPGERLFVLGCKILMISQIQHFHTSFSAARWVSEIVKEQIYFRRKLF